MAIVRLAHQLRDGQGRAVPTTAKASREVALAEAERHGRIAQGTALGRAAGASARPAPCALRRGHRAERQLAGHGCVAGAAEWR
ncbi:MAG: hypothetical protein JWM31_56 [Solirubrobacterales bacterium]|nr:hypothetical protein [Solirubrobacterales bacterium]